MKKTLLVSALALAITSSLVAGTLATYTKTTTPIEATVTAKTFNIARSEIASPDLRIAPGEKASWKFSVENFENGVITETDMDLRLDLKLSGEKMLDGLKVELYDVDTKKVLATTDVVNNEAEFLVKRTFLANEGKTRKFEIKVVCDAATEIQNGAKTNITIGITGEQTPVKYVYTRDKNVTPTKTTATHNTAVYVEKDKITLLGNDYFGDAIFTKVSEGKYNLVSSTTETGKTFVNKEFTFTDNPNNYDFSLKRLTSDTKEIIIEVGTSRTIQ